MPCTQGWLLATEAKLSSQSQAASQASAKSTTLAEVATSVGHAHTSACTLTHACCREPIPTTIHPQPHTWQVVLRLSNTTPEDNRYAERSGHHQNGIENHIQPTPATTGTSMQGKPCCRSCPQPRALACKPVKQLPTTAGTSLHYRPAAATAQTLCPPPRAPVCKPAAAAARHRGSLQP